MKVSLLKCPQGGYRPARCCAGNKFFNGCPKGYSVNTSGLAEYVHGCLTNAARGHIQYAEQRDVVLWMHCQTYVGQRILHFGAIVEAEAAYKIVAQAAAPENLFECAGLEISAVLYRAGQVRIVVENALELTGDEFRFGLRIPPTTAPAASRIFCVER